MDEMLFKRSANGINWWGLYAIIVWRCRSRWRMNDSATASASGWMGPLGTWMYGSLHSDVRKPPMEWAIHLAPLWWVDSHQPAPNHVTMPTRFNWSFVNRFRSTSFIFLSIHSFLFHWYSEYSIEILFVIDVLTVFPTYFIYLSMNSYLIYWNTCYYWCFNCFSTSFIF